MIDTELYEDEIVDDIIEDDIIEEDEVIEDEIDDSHNGIENREVLETKYNTYNNSFFFIIAFLTIQHKSLFQRLSVLDEELVF